MSLSVIIVWVFLREKSDLLYNLYIAVHHSLLYKLFFFFKSLNIYLVFFFIEPEAAEHRAPGAELLYLYLSAVRADLCSGTSVTAS